MPIVVAINLEPAGVHHPLGGLQPHPVPHSDWSSSFRSESVSALESYCGRALSASHLFGRIDGAIVFIFVTPTWRRPSIFASLRALRGIRCGCGIPRGVIGMVLVPKTQKAQTAAARARGTPRLRRESGLPCTPWRRSSSCPLVRHEHHAA